jgi:hypothetical protein
MKRFGARVAVGLAGGPDDQIRPLVVDAGVGTSRRRQW